MYIDSGILAILGVLFFLLLIGFLQFLLSGSDCEPDESEEIEEKKPRWKLQILGNDQCVVSEYDPVRGIYWYFESFDSREKAVARLEAIKARETVKSVEYIS